MSGENNPSEYEGITHEDIVAAVAILREDNVIKQGRESREAIKALEERYGKDREEDAKRWERWEASQLKTPENDPAPDPGVPAPPPPVPQGAPVGEGGVIKDKKRKGVWFAREDDSE